jgi:CheY-like chemotaxis protein
VTPTQGPPDRLWSWGLPAPPTPAHVRRRQVWQGADIRVLLVEDDPDQLAWAAESFRRCGCTVAVATDGEQAARVALSAEPDIAVVDLLLPIMDGWELVAHFRRSRPAMRVVVSSVLDLQYYPAADAVLPKPFVREQVWHLLERLSPPRVETWLPPGDAPPPVDRPAPDGLRPSRRREGVSR